MTQNGVVESCFLYARGRKICDLKKVLLDLHSVIVTIFVKISTIVYKKRYFETEIF